MIPHTRSSAPSTLPFRTLLASLAALALLATSAAPAQEGAATPPVPDVAAELVVEGLTSPVLLESPPDDPRRFVVDQTGRIDILTPEGTLLDEPFLDISERIVDLRDGFEERGLLGFAFHPEFADNGRVFVHYSAPLRDEGPEPWDHTAVVSEFTVPADTPDRADPGSERILLEVDHPNRKTNAGALAFGPDGYLYIALGEGGGAHGVGEVAYGALEVPERGNVWDALAQDLHTPYGKILRIDVDAGWPGYAVPATNPLVGKPGMDEIWAWGFRNHYRMAFDRGGDRDLFVAAVSEALWESAYRIDAPGNFGWPIREGTRCHDRQSPLDPPETCPDTGSAGWRIENPVVQYPNLNIVDSPLEGEPLGTAIVGGFVYRGEALPELTGRYVFADYSADPQTPSGTVFVATPSDEVGALWPIDELLRLDARAQGMGQDADGELYVLTREAFAPSGDSGKIFALVPASAGTDDDAGAEGTNDDSSEGANDDSNGGEGSSDASTAPRAEGGSSSSALFTATQAERGAEFYSQHCRECHAADLSGVDPFPALKGGGFFSAWEDRAVGDLLAYVQQNMPLGAPGSLDAQTYADITAHLLARWGYAEGESELPAEPGAVPDAPVESRADE